MTSKNWNISWDALWKIFFMVILGWLLFAAIDVVAALLLAIAISTAFDPIVTALEKRKIPRVLGTLFIYLLAIFIFGLVIYTFIPIALTEFSNLINVAAKFIGGDTDILNLKKFVEGLTLDINKLADVLFSGSISILGVTSKVLGGLLYAIAIFAVSFYLTIGRGGVEKFLIAILPTAYEKRIIDIYSRTSKKIGGWLLGQILLSLIIGVVTFLGLWLLGVKYSLLLGILAGLFEIVPFVGPILTGAIGVLIGLTDSLTLGIYVFILFVVIQQLENHTLVPLVMRYATALNPVVIIAAIMIGGTLFGIVGLALAVPVAVFFQEIVDSWTDEKRRRSARGLGL